jgi:hypothetical protein
MARSSDFAREGLNEGLQVQQSERQGRLRLRRELQRLIVHPRRPPTAAWRNDGSLRQIIGQIRALLHASLRSTRHHTDLRYHAVIDFSRDHYSLFDLPRRYRSTGAARPALSDPAGGCASGSPASGDDAGRRLALQRRRA